MKNGLFKFSLTTIIVLVTIVCLDITTGKIMDYIIPFTGSVGQIGKTNYTLYEVEAPIVIVGSSRASHHYDARILTDSLNKNVYNVGRDGCFFTHNCCIINTLLDRYTPETIIWEFDPSYICDSEDQLTSLYPYYGRLEHITSTLNTKLSYEEHIKLHSNIYRYNSLFIRILTRVLQGNNTPDTLLGYEPLAPKVLLTPLSLSNIEVSDKPFNKNAISRLNKTIEKAKLKGVQIILITSPKYGKIEDSRLVDKLQDICNTAGVIYIDNYQIYLNNPEFFNDPTHLNYLGAEPYTRHIASVLNTLNRI
jgi:hypothetical protein